MPVSPVLADTDCADCATASESALSGYAARRSPSPSKQEPQAKWQRSGSSAVAPSLEERPPPHPSATDRAADKLPRQTTQATHHVHRSLSAGPEGSSFAAVEVGLPLLRQSPPQPHQPPAALPQQPPEDERSILRRAELAIRSGDSARLGGVLAAVRSLDLLSVVTDDEDNPQQQSLEASTAAAAAAGWSLAGFSVLHLAAFAGSTSCLRVLLAHRRRIAAPAAGAAAGADDGDDDDAGLSDLLNAPSDRPWATLGVLPAPSPALPPALRGRGTSSDARRRFAAVAGQPPTDPLPASAAGGCSVIHLAALSCNAECLELVGEEPLVDLAWVDEARRIFCSSSPPFPVWVQIAVVFIAAGARTGGPAAQQHCRRGPYRFPSQLGSAPT